MAQQPTSGFGGFGSFLGLEPGVESRTALVANKRKERLEEFKSGMADQAAAVAPEHRGLFMQFAQLGDAMGKKMSGNQGAPVLSPEEDRSIRIMETANQRIKAMHQDPDFATLDPMEKSFRTQKAVADAAAEFGDYNAYSNIATDLYNKRISFRQAEAQTKVLEGEAATVDSKVSLYNKQAEEDMKTLAAGQPVQMIRVEDGSPNLDETLTVFQSADGTLRDEEGNQVKWGEVMPLDDGLALADARDARGGAAFTPADLVKQIGVSNIQQLKDGLNDLDTMAEVSERLVGALEMASDPQQIVGSQGGLVSVASNMFNLAIGTGKNVRIFDKIDKDGNGVGQGTSFREATDKYIEDDWVPAEFRKNAEAQLRYKSAVMQMVYATARLEEPGARQLSDADIKNAMDTLGVRSGDPVAVLSTLQSVMHGRIKTSRSKYDRLGGQITAYGLNEDVAYRRILGQNPREVIDRATEALFRPNTVQTRAEQREELTNQAANLGLAPEDVSVLDYYTTE